MLYGALLPIQAIRFKLTLYLLFMCFMFYACLILLHVIISGMLCNAVIRNKRIHS